MKRILFVEDDLSLIHGLSYALKKQGYELHIARTYLEAKTLWSKINCDLIILDVSLPDGSGYDLCQDIRKTSKVPILFLTAADEETEITMGLDIGGDDYITKPFSPIVLMARIKLLLRQKPEATTSNVKDFQGLVIDEVARIVTNNGERLDLSPKEYELLVYLAVNRKVALSREQILNALWGYDYFGDLRTVDTHIKKLRAKLGDKGDLIETVRGYGYRFEG